MKQEMNEVYESPRVEVLEVEVEKGFAGSLGGTTPEVGTEPASLDEWY